MNFQMFKLDLEKTEEPEITLPASIGSSKKQDSSRETSFLLYWLTQSLWLSGSQHTVENSSRDGNTRPPICLLWNLYAGQEATVRMGHGTTDWFQIGKGVHQSCIFSPWLFNLYAEYIMRYAGLMKQKLESRLPGEISITSDTQMIPFVWQKVKN